jgi:DNA-binding CsgD family transcriptional regulator/sugar-specific transcriptional regulator TrmB
VPTPPSPFESLGLGIAAQSVYAELLSSPHSSVKELAATCRLDTSTVGEAIEELRKLDLVEEVAGVSATADMTPRYRACDPATALAEHVRRRAQHLQRAQQYAESLAATRLAPPGETMPGLRLLPSANDVQAWRRELFHRAQSRVSIFNTGSESPTLMSELIDASEEAIGRGIEVRVMLDRTSLVPDVLTALRTARGTQQITRVVGLLPMEMILADAGMCFIPVTPEDHQVSCGGVLSGRTSLIEAASRIFDLYWKLGLPVSMAGTQHVARPPGAVPTPHELQLLALVAAGVKDEVIADRLGLSQRTLSRRLADLMGRLGAQTRFQAGFLAARHGWL